MKILYLAKLTFDMKDTDKLLSMNLVSDWIKLICLFATYKRMENSSYRKVTWKQTLK